MLHSTFTRCEVILPRNEISRKIEELDFYQTLSDLFELVMPDYVPYLRIEYSLNFLKIKLVKQY